MMTSVPAFVVLLAGALGATLALHETVGPPPGPLFLTPLIREGRTDDARRTSRVPPTSGMALESYSGFLTVRPNDDAHMFFWFFPCTNSSQDIPVLLWMTGGPGTTVLSGLFAEIGPYHVTDDVQVKLRDVAWTSRFHVIFIDTPVGTGFSFAKSPKFYSKTTSEIARDVHVALQQFFRVFSAHAKKDFYVAGESYAAKYAIGVASEISSSKSQQPIGLKGVILVSSMFDPVNEIAPADYLVQLGLMDKLYGIVHFSEELFQLLARLGLYGLASQVLSNFFKRGGNVITDDTSSYELIRLGDGDNILYDNMSAKFSNFVALVEDSQVRRALHVGNVPFRKISYDVLDTIVGSGDLAKSERPALQIVLDEGYKVLMMSGNMDFMVTPTATATAADALKWKCSKQYASAPSVAWKVHQGDTNTAGYTRCACNFCYAIVRNAGHRLPGDEPVKAYDLVDRFVRGVLTNYKIASL